MPAIIGPLEIVNVGGEGIVHMGDSAFTSPKTAAKTSAGPGGFNTGGLVAANNVFSSTNVISPGVVDQPQVKNN